MDACGKKENQKEKDSQASKVRLEDCRGRGWPRKKWADVIRGEGRGSEGMQGLWGNGDG